MMQRINQESSNLCDLVLDLDDSIRSVTLVNNHGRAVEKSARSSIGLEDHKNEMLLMHSALQISMGRDFDEDFGEIGYTFVGWKNLSMFSFPLGKYIVLVASQANKSPITLARKIIEIIKEFGSR